jgi:hypothetical protein
MTSTSIEHVPKLATDCQWSPSLPLQLNISRSYSLSLLVAMTSVQQSAPHNQAVLAWHRTACLWDMFELAMGQSAI